MKIAYHPDSATLSAAVLDAWLAATLAAWPDAGAGTLITVRDPKHPMRIEADTAADDRTTQGGRQFSKIKYTRREIALEFPPIRESEAAIWRAFYAATNGFRLPFIIEHPLTMGKIVVHGGQAFPFTLTSRDGYSGSVKWSERL